MNILKGNINFKCIKCSKEQVSSVATQSSLHSPVLTLAITRQEQICVLTTVTITRIFLGKKLQFLNQLVQCGSNFAITRKFSIMLHKDNRCPQKTYSGPLKT